MKQLALPVFSGIILGYLAAYFILDYFSGRRTMRFRRRRRT